VRKRRGRIDRRDDLVDRREVHHVADAGKHAKLRIRHERREPARVLDGSITLSSSPAKMTVGARIDA
jgi:hypothetical protein